MKLRCNFWTTVCLLAALAGLLGPACYKVGYLKGDDDSDSTSSADADTDGDSDGDSDTTTSLHRGKSLLDIHGTGPRDIWASGGCGLLLHFDGEEWQEVDLGVNDNFNTVWAVAPDDVLVGGNRHSENNPIECQHKFWGPYGKGVMQHFDGTEWRVSFERASEYFPIASIWGSSVDNIYAVGGDFLLEGQSGINHFDGESWSNISEDVLPQDCSTKRYRYLSSILSIWGYADGRLYLICQTGDVDYIWAELLFFPDSFKQECSFVDFDNSPTPGEDPYGDLTTPTAVWGDSDGNVFATSMDGLIYLNEGFTWRTIETGSTDPLWNVWGLGPNDVYAVGAKGRVIHYDGKLWSNMNTGIPGDLYGVWGTEEAIYAVGDDDSALPPEERSPAIYQLIDDTWTRVY